MTLEQQNVEIAKMLGWEYFPESQCSLQFPDGSHKEFYITDVWILKPTQRYKDDPCHFGFNEYYDEEVEVERKDLFENYAYSLTFHDNWHFLMNALDFIESTSMIYTIITTSETKTNCEIYTLNSTLKIAATASSKKEAIFEAVSKFAKHYNEQNSNSNVTPQL